MSEKAYYSSDIEQMPKRFRTQFINSITGFKSVALIGSINQNAQTNLATFSQIFHLGANPALIGIIFRPAVVPRHTYTNILQTKEFTINHIHESFVAQAHQTSAKYPADVSEFKAVGLTEFYGKNKAPFVQESHLKIGLAYRDEKLIELNDTILVIGEITEVIVDNDCILNDGFVDIQKAGSITASGLDAYCTAQKLTRFNYAQPNEKPQPIQY